MQHVHAAPLLGGPRAPSMCWFDVGWEIRTPPPHNKRRGLEQRDWNRERGSKGKKRRQMDSVVIKDGGGLRRRPWRTGRRPAERDGDADRKVTRHPGLVPAFESEGGSGGRPSRATAAAVVSGYDA